MEIGNKTNTDKDRKKKYKKYTLFNANFCSAAHIYIQLSQSPMQETKNIN